MKDVIDLLNSSEKTEWDNPIDFEEPQLPIFDTNVYPEWIKKFVEQVAEETQTPICFAAVSMISVLSTTVLSKFRLKVRGQWTEPIGIYSVVVAEPSARKSSVFNLLYQPIFDYELKSYNEKNTNFKRYIAADATQEKLIELMANNNQSITLATAEGDEVFGMMKGKYTSITSFDVYLKSYSSDPIFYDRKNSGTLTLQKPTMAMTLFVQPSVIGGMSNEFSDRGVTQRFIYSLPKSNVGFRDPDPKLIDQKVKNNYKKNIVRLLEIANDEIEYVTLSNKAQEYLNEMIHEIELELRNQDLSTSIKAWLGKLIGQILRITALLHISFEITKGTAFQTEIGVDTLKRVYNLKDYFIKHAKKAYRQINNTNQETADIKYVLNKIKHLKKLEIKRRDVQQLTKHRLTSVELSKVLGELEDFNYISNMKKDRKQIIKVNPIIIN
ncbi:hypothetical protein GCM10011351_20830 [Paraliobacillus quinghaiensis]|uniref:DUF3987 domain-containing protein n=1 Tax=Paraliobacillus quinghaiensis TaxID=470815 RepID=A0A917WW83_9BACI|nr:YfjI family protein [Paraliobacillus quinghaiensis]GGM34661.1 hypothetical protein GCM10011351_20830 [Paraliobacillus quinghaiensis]